MYTQEQVEKIVKEILYKYYFIGDSVSITKDTNIVVDLGLDSLDLVEIICKFEKETNIVLSDSDTNNILASAWSFDDFCLALQKSTINYEKQRTPKNTHVIKEKKKETQYKIFNKIKSLFVNTK